MLAWPDFKESAQFRQICSNRLERQYWTWYFDRMYSADRPDTWDYQWTFACWLHGGLSITPSVNLVSNLGFRSDGTHTTSDSPWANLPTYDIGHIVHPPKISADRSADWWEFVHHYGGEWYQQQVHPLTRLRRLLSRVKRALVGSVQRQ